MTNRLKYLKTAVDMMYIPQLKQEEYALMSRINRS